MFTDISVDGLTGISLDDYVKVRHHGNMKLAHLFLSRTTYTNDPELEPGDPEFSFTHHAH